MEPVPKKITVAGFATCNPFKQAKTALLGLQVIFPTQYAVTVNEFETRDEYVAWLAATRDSIGAPQHKTSPLVWFDEARYLGGRDDTLAWCRRILTASEEVKEEVREAVPNVDVVPADHGFDYDLVVIGGGSGGLACAKEAKLLGAQKVAVLDYVKPSPLGSKWGLGGTCVNVGCIPKKLFHRAATLGEQLHDATRYGWSLDATTVSHSWEVLREAVQDHIKGLNFGYRVELREKGVTYLNKLGRMVDAHTVQVTDAKGGVQTISAARVVLAVGGRPSPLRIPGGELAVSSDDLFSLETDPGKVCVVGAGYIAVECGGFLAGLGHNVTLLSRSRPLRLFDSEVVKYVVQHLTSVMHVDVKEETLPRSLERLPNGRILVRYGGAKGGGEEVSEEFDTVLVATGRYPDLAGLGLESVGVSLHPESGKVVTQNEQTSVPHIYAVGDVVHEGQELTTVAIAAGRLLAQRLYGNGSGTMKYSLVPSAVFSPLELGTVGLTEEQAVQQFGQTSVDCYLSEFVHLEGTLLEETKQPRSFVKVVVRKTNSNSGASASSTSQDEEVLGLHLACPAASEIIQGFALALQAPGGLRMHQIQRSLGVHPSVAEDVCLLKHRKSSNASFAKAGC